MRADSVKWKQGEHPRQCVHRRKCHCRNGQHHPWPAQQVKLPKGLFAECTAVGIDVPETWAFTALIERPNGELSLWAREVVCAAAGVAVAVFGELPEGELLHCAATQQGHTGFNNRGAARIRLRVGDSAVAPSVGLALRGVPRGYVVGGLPWVEPTAGPLSSGTATMIAGTTPAAGAAAVLTPVGYNLRRVRSVFGALTTDATVANRFAACFALGPGTDLMLVGSNVNAQTASLTRLHHFSRGGSALAPVLGYFAANLADFDLAVGQTCTLFATGMAAGDAWTDFAVFGEIEWTL